MPKAASHGGPIRFSAAPSLIGGHTLLRVPKSESAKLPSRGMVMAEGAVNGMRGYIPLEPDGLGSHWFEVTKAMRKAVEDAGDKVDVEFSVVQEWPEPEIPADVQKALAANPKAHDVWMDTTPAARWDWIRWIRATNSTETRQKRIMVACSKLKSGMRRPCCFNRAACTEPAVSKGGKLLGPA